MVLNNYVIAAIKKTAQNNYPLIAKRDKLQKKIADLTAKKEALEQEFMLICQQISVAETGIIALTGGMTSSDLVNRIEEEGQKVKYELNPSFLTSNGDGTYNLSFPEVPENYTSPVAEEVVEETNKEL